MQASYAFDSTVCSMVITVHYALSTELGEVCKCGFPRFGGVRPHLVPGHLLFREVVALVHLARKINVFGLVSNDNVDGLAFLFLFCQLAAECDDMCDRKHWWCPCAPCA